MCMARERLDKMLAARGVGSRKEVGAWIRNGQVTVNDIICRDPAVKVDWQIDVICACGQSVRARRERYIMLNKPAGVISATQDTLHKTVLELLPEHERGALAPVGRLDKDTEGLVLLTDDGGLNHALTAPRRHVDKRYQALVSGTMASDAVEQFANGVILDDGTHCLPAILIEQALDAATGWYKVEVILHEGKYHQVKRMIAAVGGRVEYLRRLSIGPLMLDQQLAPGEYRALTEHELEALFRAVGRSQ